MHEDYIAMVAVIKRMKNLLNLIWLQPTLKSNNDKRIHVEIHFWLSLHASITFHFSIEQMKFKWKQSKHDVRRREKRYFCLFYFIFVLFQWICLSYSIFVWSRPATHVYETLVGLELGLPSMLLSCDKYFGRY